MLCHELLKKVNIDITNAVSLLKLLLTWRWYVWKSGFANVLSCPSNATLNSPVIAEYSITALAKYEEFQILS